MKQKEHYKSISKMDNIIPLYRYLVDCYSQQIDLREVGALKDVIMEECLSLVEPSNGQTAQR